jgi:hypothetical protein
MRSILTLVFLFGIGLGIDIDKPTPTSNDVIAKIVIRTIEFIEYDKNIEELVPIKFSLFPVLDLDGNVVGYYCAIAIKDERLVTYEERIATADKTMNIWRKKWKEVRKYIYDFQSDEEKEKYKNNPEFFMECNKRLEEWNEEVHNIGNSVFPIGRHNYFNSIQEFRDPAEATIGDPMPTPMWWYIAARIAAEDYFGTTDVKFVGLRIVVERTKEGKYITPEYSVFEHNGKRIYICASSIWMFPTVHTEDEVISSKVTYEEYRNRIYTVDGDVWGESRKKEWQKLEKRLEKYRYNIRDLGDGVFEIYEITKEE